MDAKRQGEISRILFKAALRQKNIRFTPDMKRKIGDDAAAVDVDVKEIAELLKMILHELVEESFADFVE